MRGGLGDREAARRGCQVRAEERKRQLVGCPRLVVQHRGELVEPLAMVLDQLDRPPERILERVAVTREGQPRSPLRQLVESPQVVTERIRIAVRPESYR